ncbi:DUF6445 family protein [Hirschia baltica]|uniref:Uncharacterized protein n=1 Tax=Hirschia baltica (strain ATCC 49814 / DSM 5838 / IFAM 1418) TaxID=582402 RepID=C6XNJ7_HIRBI|nr:DUF6445 family protein [Hirschia baltica]ACT60141.1 conserved hypothetical protein [Hirschia baltica ATCC 49814]
MTDTRFEIHRFGKEQNPIVVIDDFSSSPDTLLKTAHSSQYGPGGRHYPGLRAQTSPAYLQDQDTLLKHILADVFAFNSGAHFIECNYSIVNTPPEKLTPIQRIPHFDGTDTNTIALLHYLCPEQDGGTGFYRHNSTGFEHLSADRLGIYDAKLKQDVAIHGLPNPAYFNQSDAIFECIGTIPAKFNRMVIYKGINLHSGLIKRPENIGQRIENARITLNTFMQARH